jgi:hypothetical protein
MGHHSEFWQEVADRDATEAMRQVRALAHLRLGQVEEAIDVLERLKKLGVTTVSFYGVHLEVGSGRGASSPSRGRIAENRLKLRIEAPWLLLPH